MKIKRNVGSCASIHKYVVYKFVCIPLLQTHDNRMPEDFCVYNIIIYLDVEHLVWLLGVPN